MEKVENGRVRVYLETAYWETRVLSPYFEEIEPTEHKTMFFTSDNIAFDVESRCYVCRLAQLGDGSVLRDVYIPERYVLGVAVRLGSQPPEEKQKIGYV
jgi:hypothetical protein